MESKDNIYRLQVKRKMDDLSKLCYQNNMPCFFVVAVGDKPNGKLDLRIASYLPETMYAETEDTVFADLINVTNGFSTIPPTDRANFALDMDDLMLPPDLEDSENMDETEDIGD